MEVLGEILVVPFSGQGHLFPCMELCKHLSTYNYKPILVIPSHLSSSIPSSLRAHHPLIEVVEIPNSSPSPPPEMTTPPQPEMLDDGTRPGPGPGLELNPFHKHHEKMGSGPPEMTTPPQPEMLDDGTRPGPGLGLNPFHKHHEKMGSGPPEMTAPPQPEMLDDGSRPGPGPGPNPFHKHHEKMGSGLEAFLTERYNDSTQIRPVCAVLDVMMSWSKEFFVKFDIQIVSLLTSGACSSAMDYASWKDHALDMKPGEVRKFHGLPEEMAVSYSDMKRQQRHGPPHRPAGDLNGQTADGPDGPAVGMMKLGIPNQVNEPSGGMKFGPHGPVHKPRWLDEVDGSTALFFNTCDGLEHQFLSYMANQMDKPVYGIGPLLPEQYWKSIGSIMHDGQVRSNRKSNYTENQVIQWLDKKPSQSVIYVSFGSEVGPTMEEYEELANALEELKRPFIWVIQPNSGKAGPPLSLMGEESGSQNKEEGYYTDGLEERIGDRGLIIKGWAPQLLILSHPAVGGFLSHCGWNSTTESIGRGIPILAWPIRGDQFHNANLVAKHLRVGHLLLTDDDTTQMVKKETIVRGIDSLLDDKEVHKTAMELCYKFKNGFPSTSVAALKSFIQAMRSLQ